MPVATIHQGPTVSSAVYKVLLKRLPSSAKNKYKNQGIREFKFCPRSSYL